MSMEFGYGRTRVHEGWRKVHNEAINNLFSSQNVIKEDDTADLAGKGNIRNMQ